MAPGVSGQELETAREALFQFGGTSGVVTEAIGDGDLDVVTDRGAGRAGGVDVTAAVRTDRAVGGAEVGERVGVAEISW